MKEAALTAAPWHINQMDCGGMEMWVVGVGGWGHSRESSHCMEGDIDLPPPRVTSGILYTLANTPVWLVVQSIFSGLGPCSGSSKAVKKN